MGPAHGYSYASIADELNGLPHLTGKEKASLLSILAASGVFEEEEYQEGWIDMGTTRSGVQHPTPPGPCSSSNSLGTASPPTCNQVCSMARTTGRLLALVPVNVSEVGTCENDGGLVPSQVHVVPGCRRLQPSTRSERLSRYAGLQ
jgi:hypothetical protein